MIEMTLGEVAAVVGGTLRGDPTIRVTGPVEYDSRTVAPGGMFAAFVGERVDGHDFAADALAAGAVAVLGTRPLDGVPMVLVDDPRAAMAALAKVSVERLVAAGGLTVVGLTGSSGKTTTKDCVAAVASLLGPTVAPPGSLNNELGYPYTALRADAGTRCLVLEMGSRGPGHLAHLCGIVRPQIGVVLNVGVAHLGEFGSVEAIAAAKGELVEALPADGVAVLNADDPRVAAMAGRTAASVLLVGQAPHARVRAVDVRLDERGRAAYTLVAEGGSAPVRLRLAGAHQVGNTLAAAGVGLALGLDVARVAEALSEVRAVSPRRMDVFDRPDGVTVIDDSYNANPASTSAALRALATLGQGRRTVAVLGYMAELGDYEVAGHEQVGRLAADLGVDLLVVVGDAAPIDAGARSRPDWRGESVTVTDQDAAVAALRDRLRPGDVVLVKGSRYRTWQVADWLREPVGEAARDGVVAR